MFNPEKFAAEPELVRSESETTETQRELLHAFARAEEGLPNVPSDVEFESVDDIIASTGVSREALELYRKGQVAD